MKLHDQLWAHPRVAPLSAKAIGAYALIASYSESNELDGLVPSPVWDTGLLELSTDAELRSCDLLRDGAGGACLTRWKEPKDMAHWLVLGHPSDRYPLLAILTKAGATAERERRKISPRLRKQIITRDLGICGICGLHVAPAEIHIDHIYPVALGGLTEKNNLQVTHARCNLAKGARVFGESE